MRVAYLVLCHTDPIHIGRLANRLVGKDDEVGVYIHVDKEANIEDFKKSVGQNKNIVFLEDRVKVYWGGFSAVEATILLLKEAIKKTYDRYVLLQGLDYPLVPNEKIKEFFLVNKEVEFIRACNSTNSKVKKLYSKSRNYWFFERKNLFKKILNKLNDIPNLKTRKGYVVIDKIRQDIYWGAAQWALTEECVKYIINFHEKNEKFNRYFRYVFPADETYFHSIIFNSEYSKKTLHKGPEKEISELCEIRNLHYFEYFDKIKIFTISDYEELKKQNCLFIRKTTTGDSFELLNKLDLENIEFNNEFKMQSYKS